MENMQAVILAGGMGTRLKSVVSDVPKPMAPVNGKPFLEYLLQQLIRSNIRNVILSVGYKWEIIRDYFGDGAKWGLNIQYAVENEPLGTGGAIREASRLVTADAFIVMNGDSYFDIDIVSLIQFHRAMQSTITLALVSMENVSRYGSVELDKNSEIVKFHEKKRDGHGLINSGIYVINQDVARQIPPGNVSFEKDVLPFQTGNRMFGAIREGYFIDIGIPEDYRSFSEAMHGQLP
jgi:D-glycero-alpha-D-manno-heptose 1-phosphate guanylyltransferase